ncbi:MAG: fibronectin type III domain-containing protein, partial [Acutalibacteraceae bacterium]
KLKDITNLRLVSAGSDSIKVAWDKVDKAEYYKVSVAVSGQSEYKDVAKTSKCTYTLKNLNGKTGYKIRVVAVVSGNRSERESITLYTKPGEVKGLKATKSTYNSVTLSWNEAAGANKYYIYACKTADGKYSLKGTTSKTSFTASLNSAGTKYYFKIRAAVETKNQKTLGTYGKTVSASTKAYPFEISLKSPNIRKGEYIYLSVPHYKNVQWTSSDTNVISLSGSRAFAASTGTATVTASCGGKKTSVKITVSAAVINYMSCVYDYTAGKWVFSNRMYDRCYPASITKLITALVALKYMSVNDTIYVGSELNLVESNSSRCGIQMGEKFRLGDLLYGMLLPSGGDAAYTIAVNCARKVSGKPNMGYVEAKNYFVSLMNSYMKSLGAVGTHCVNPHGYPVNGHYSTPYDLVLVAKQVLKNPTLKTITSTRAKYVTALTGKGRSWYSTNQLLNPSSSFYSPYAHGMKTGTVNNGYTGIVSAATKNGRTIITVAIGCESFNARYNATHKLYNAYLY